MNRELLGIWSALRNRLLKAIISLTDDNIYIPNGTVLFSPIRNKKWQGTQDIRP